MYLFVNGSIKHISEASISPLDHGFLYGLGIFETFRTYRGHPFLLDDHFSRLGESAVEMGIEIQPYNRAHATGIIKELLKVNGLDDGYFRWNISAGEREIGLSTERYTAPNTIIFVKELPNHSIEEKRGITLKQRRNTPEGKFRLKSHHYLNNIMAKREVGMDPQVEGIFLTEKGYLSEGVVSNLFWVKENTLFTPNLETNPLNGITRQFVMALALKLGYVVKEGCYYPEELLDANEVFVTNSIQEMVPLYQYDDQVFPGKQGDFYLKLHKQYRQHSSFLWSRSEL